MISFGKYGFSEVVKHRNENIDQYALFPWHDQKEIKTKFLVMAIYLSLQRS